MLYGQPFFISNTIWNETGKKNKAALPISQLTMLFSECQFDCQTQGEKKFFGANGQEM